MNWRIFWRIFRIVLKFGILGLLLFPFFSNPEKMVSMLVPFFGAFVLLFMAFGYLPDVVGKPIAKKVKEKRKKMNFWRKFWRFMIR